MQKSFGGSHCALWIKMSNESLTEILLNISQKFMKKDKFIGFSCSYSGCLGKSTPLPLQSIPLESIDNIFNLSLIWTYISWRKLLKDFVGVRKGKRDVSIQHFNLYPP